MLPDGVSSLGDAQSLQHPDASLQCLLGQLFVGQVIEIVINLSNVEAGGHQARDDAHIRLRA